MAYSDEVPADVEAPTPPTEAGNYSTVWSPAAAARLREIGGLRDEAEAPDLTEARRLYDIAMREYPLYDDTALRPMSEDDRSDFLAYVERRLDLPGPPTFLACATPGLQRAAMVSYHQTQVEGVLIADVPARARLGKHLPRRSILRELTDANARTEAGKLQMTHLLAAVQRVVLTAITR